MPIVYTSGLYHYKKLPSPSTSRSVLNSIFFDSNLVFSLDSDRDYLTVLNDAQEMLRREHAITRVTIQIEPYDEQIMNACETCRRPEI